MLQLDQRTSAPRAISVSISTPVWMVMWMQPRIFAPFSGWLAAYLARRPIRAGISDSAMISSLRPQSAREMSATLKSVKAALMQKLSIRRLRMGAVAAFDNAPSEPDRRWLMDQLQPAAAPLGQV